MGDRGVGLTAIGAQLRTLREELRAELDDLTRVTRDPSATIGFGKRVGEGINEAIGRIERVGQADVLSSKLADVDRAIAKVGDGTYGLCDVCGETIGEARLEARPWAVTCLRCSQSSPAKRTAR